MEDFLRVFGMTCRTHRRPDVVSTCSPTGHGSLLWNSSRPERRTGRTAGLSLDRVYGPRRGYLLHEGWKAMLRVFILALVMDAIYQFIVLRWFYPGEAVITALILAFVPYLLIRGPVNRLARVWNRKTAGSGRSS
jgi:hypothetical protein